MPAPLTFAWRNVLFGADRSDAWALYRLHTRAYPGLPAGGKLELLSELAAFAVSVEADFQLLRVSRGWSATDYRRGAEAGIDPRWGFPERVDALLDRHEAAVGPDALARPEVFLAVALGSPGQQWWKRLARDFGLRDAAGLSQRRMDAVLDAEAAVFGRVTDYLDAERATTRELQWLIRRAFHRAGHEPWLDEFWVPQALVLDADDEEGGRRYVPFEADILRLFDEPIDVERDHIRGGATVQTTLVLGALPETVSFPGRQAELLFAPLEAVDFPVDACVAARWIPNDRALALVRRKIVDADHAYGEEAMGDHGPTAQTSVRPDLARELEEQLAASDHNTLLRAQVSYVVPNVMPGVDLLAARRDLAKLELSLAAEHHRELFLADLLDGAIAAYDAVLIDCPPSLGLLTVNAFVAATEVVIPVDMTDEGALQGAVEVRGIVRHLAKRSELRVAALVRTKVDRRRIVYQRMNDSLPGLGLPIANTEIPLTADFQTAAAERQTLFSWRQDSLGALAYRRLALELTVPGSTDGTLRSAPVWA